MSQRKESPLGHALEFIMADVLARYARQQQKPVIFSIGTDEHGGKIAEKAAELNMAPQAFTDQTSAKFAELAKQLNLSNDRFIRTTDEAHEKRAQIIWEKLAGDIYKGKYEGLYCTGCETFVTEAIAKENKGVCPHHNRPYEKLVEENYYFRLSKYAPQIKEAIDKNTLRVLPESRRQEILNVINTGLEDISISRPKEKIAWGIPVPGDDTQVMYVWFEALMNYITVLGYPENEDFAKFWPANVQVIGKDILRFHAAIWPGMLLGLGLPLPQTLFVHGFITVNDQKMSKSLGNSVSPSEIVAKYGTDAFRYYFLRHIPSHDDGDFSWERMEASYNNELANELGNAVQRTLAMVQKYLNGVVGNTPDAPHDRAKFDAFMNDCKFDRALDEVWEQVRGLNQYVEEQKPWEIAKTGDAEHLREVLAYQVACILEIAELLTPFLPGTSETIKEIFADGTIHPPKTTLFPKHDQPQKPQPHIAS